MIELAPIDSLQPAAYNPRKNDQRRLDLVTLSLSKLGFLLPIYATRAGEIISGHQRHDRARELGCKFIPVSYIAQEFLDERMSLNIAFNRATNDMRVSDSSRSATAALLQSDVERLAAELPDRRPDSDEFFPCLGAKTVSVKSVIAANTGQWNSYTRNMARVLARAGVVMPIVVTGDLRVVNGLGRVHFLAEQGEDEVPAVVVSDREAALAEAMLNLLTMDFDVKERYADILRYNSFRRVRRVRSWLGMGFTFKVAPGARSQDVRLDRASDRAKWLKEHGRSILDFGAGHLHETEMLREIGCYVTPFEPYRITGSDQINKTESLKVVREFLHDVADGRQWTSIFISSVLNSVPFVEDRQHIAALLGACATAQSKVYAFCPGVLAPNIRAQETMNIKAANSVVFSVDYEPNTTIGDFAAGKPKAQKYHTTQELNDLFAPHFARVVLQKIGHNVGAVCSTPRPVDAGRLRAAIEFEFNLPYPDGSRMELVEEALQAFSRRLGRTL